MSGLVKHAYYRSCRRITIADSKELCTAEAMQAGGDPQGSRPLGSLDTRGGHVSPAAGGVGPLPSE